jgi:hypothetical protein
VNDICAGVTTIAGGKSNIPGYRDGPSEDAKFSTDFDVVYVKKMCPLLVIDRGNAALSKIWRIEEDDQKWVNKNQLKFLTELKLCQAGLTNKNQTNKTTHYVTHILSITSHGRAKTAPRRNKIELGPKNKLQENQNRRRLFSDQRRQPRPEVGGGEDCWTWGKKKRPCLDENHPRAQQRLESGLEDHQELEAGGRDRILGGKTKNGTSAPALGKISTGNWQLSGGTDLRTRIPRAVSPVSALWAGNPRHEAKSRLANRENQLRAEIWHVKIGWDRRQNQTPRAWDRAGKPDRTPWLASGNETGTTKNLQRLNRSGCRNRRGKRILAQQWM